MRLFGGAVLLCGALFAYVLYSRFVSTGRAMLEGYIAFIKRVREEICCYSKGVGEIAATVSDKRIEGFLSLIKGGKRVSEAFAESETAALSRDERELILECFESLGTGYLDTEIKRLDGYIKRLTELEERGKAEAMKNKRVTLAILLAISLGLVILVI